MSDRFGGRVSGRREMKTRSASAVIGLTGGLACGKSEVGRILARLGAAVLDTDEVTRALQRPGRPVFRAIVRRFGPTALTPAGELDRRALARRVFGDPASRRALEAIVHPAVFAEAGKWIRARRREKKPAVVLVPLLYETGRTKDWDAVWCVTSPKPAAMARLKARGLTAAEARARWAAQLAPAEKARRADVVIRNNGSLDELKRKVRAEWNRTTREEP